LSRYEEVQNGVKEQAVRILGKLSRRVLDVIVLVLKVEPSPPEGKIDDASLNQDDGKSVTQNLLH